MQGLCHSKCNCSQNICNSIYYFCSLHPGGRQSSTAEPMSQHCPNTVQGSMTQKKDAGMHKFVSALFNSSLALARKSKPTRHLSSLCSVTSWEKQPGEQADARSQLTGKAKHWGRRGRIGNLTSSQLECISATRKQAPALWDENVETRAWRELQQRTSLLSLYPKPQVTATFHKPSS